jgi:hypothetical protein
MEVTVMRMRFLMDQGQIDRVFALARQVLPQLAIDHQVWLYNISADLRPPVRFKVGVVREMRGELCAAEAELRTTAAEGTENPHIVALAEEMGRYSSPFFGISQVQYGGLLYEWNDLKAAQ